MNAASWILIANEPWRGALAALGSLDGPTIAVVVGARELVDEVADAGPAEVLWIEPVDGTSAESYAGALADVIAAASPGVLVSTSDPVARVLIGAAAARIHARVVPRVVGLARRGDDVLLHREAVGGDTIETLCDHGPVAAIFVGEDAPPNPGAAAPVRRLDLVAVPMVEVASQPIAVASGLDDAQRVVSFGRGVRAKDDVALLRSLAEALDAELACSMPIADDLGWLEKSRYVGRSGNHIAPALYLAVGIAGAAQHMEGVRGARVVAAINSDPQARIFQTADYGIVGDLYEVVPALIAEVHK